MSNLGIGQLAERVGVAIHTVRYFERNVTRVKRSAEAKLTDLEPRIAELQRIRRGLRTLIAACPGHGRAGACPILNAFTQENPR